MEILEDEVQGGKTIQNLGFDGSELLDFQLNPIFQIKKRNDSLLEIHAYFKQINICLKK